MKVKELIQKLAAFNQDSEIHIQNDNWNQLEMEVQSLNDAPVFVVYGEGEEE